MDLDLISANDFKDYFRRDFPYLPVYDNTALYNSGEVVYYPTARLFYTCAVDGTTGVTPSASTPQWIKKTDSTDNYIQDEDIEKAFGEAKMQLNQALFGDDAEIRIGYLYLTALYLCNDIKTALRGITSSGYFPMTGRSVGNVSESYGIPQAYLDNPLYAFYTQNGYGMKYLALVYPRLSGNVVGVCGYTHP